MNIQGLKYFLVVAEELNITKAAAKLYVSQQYLSAHIHRLEEEYGVTLFQRKPTFQLTLPGEAMVFYAHQILNSEDSMKARFADLVDNCRGRLKIGMSRQRAQVFFSNLWERYLPKHPNISVSLEENYTVNLLQQLRTDQLDLCICIDVAPARDLEITPLVTEQLCCSISPTLLEAYHPATAKQDIKKFFKDGVNLLNICDLPFFLLPSRNRIRLSLDQLFAANGVYPNVLLETNSQELMLKMADNGVGVISPMYLYHYWQSTSVASQPPQVFPVHNNIPLTNLCLVCRKGPKPPTYVRDMKLIIIEEMERYRTTVNKMNPFKLIF